jgi:hypothetical protein
MKAFVIGLAAAISAAAFATVYQAEVWLYRVDFNACTGPGVAEWFAGNPSEPLPLPSEEAIQAVQIEQIPVPLPPVANAAPTSLGLHWLTEWMPGAVAHPGPSLLIPAYHTGTITFRDSTPVQYLTRIAGDEYNVVGLDTAPGTRLFLAVSPENETHARLHITSEYSLITNRTPVTGAEDLAVGEPDWASGRLSSSFAAPLGEWVGALVPVGGAPARALLLPLVRLTLLGTDTGATSKEQKYFEYDINGDGIVHGIPNLEHSEGVLERRKVPEPPAPDTPVPPRGYRTNQFPSYSMESKVINVRGTLPEFVRHAPAWPVLANARLVHWPEPEPLEHLAAWWQDAGGRLDAEPELVSAPRVTSGYIMGSSTLFKVVLRNPGPLSGTNGSFSNIGEFLGKLSAEHPALQLAGHAIIADWRTDGLAVPYNVRGWGPSHRSDEVRAESGILMSTWVEPTGDPEVLRVDYYFLSPYVLPYDKPPKTEDEARALLGEREFRYLYECRDGETVCFISSISPNDHYLILVTVDKVDSPGQRYFEAPPTAGYGGGEFGPRSFGGGATAPGKEQPRATSPVQNVEVGGEVRVRAGVRTR